MAVFNMELPTDILKDLQRIERDAENIFGQMTQAGAEAVKSIVVSNVPASFKDSKIMDCLSVTKVYKTPSDGGINTKVGFFGYFDNENGVRTPAPLVCNVFEYGSSKFGKQPFFRKSFKKEVIEKAMLEAQKKASGGLLDE